MKKGFKISINSPVVLGFSAICLIALLLSIFTKGMTNKLLFMTYHSSLTNPLTYLRFFTHIFGHSGLDHFMGNITYILLLGPLLEEKYGSKLLIHSLIITALITGIVNYVFFPQVALCGASGVVFTFILLSSFTGFRDKEIPLTFILVAIIFIGQQVYEGIMVQDNISNLSHVLGGVVGSVMGYLLNKNGIKRG
ncbi:MAG: rhomboid family intramembrane serine protease [Catonella sp.]|uniref:rhomboid family intramembrane serine protease n=1 Tax=Catonella sp. TaxID=2382125 RepID=UPI003FA13966